MSSLKRPSFVIRVDSLGCLFLQKFSCLAFSLDLADVVSFFTSPPDFLAILGIGMLFSQLLLYLRKTV